MARSMDAATASAIVASTVYGNWFIRLDIVGDPVYINTGFSDVYFAAGMGYDVELVGLTFLRGGNVLTIDTITDSQSGSQGLTITLPGVDLSMDYLHQILNNADIWQAVRCFLWFATCNEDGSIIGKPIRIKTGRLDQLSITIDPDNNVGTLAATIESQSSYQGEASNFKYSDQARVDPADISQQYVSWLANQVAQIGHPTVYAAGGAGGGGLGGGLNVKLY